MHRFSVKCLSADSAPVDVSRSLPSGSGAAGACDAGIAADGATASGPVDVSSTAYRGAKTCDVTVAPCIRSTR
jgi:hypothetical protein